MDVGPTCDGVSAAVRQVVFTQPSRKCYSHIHETSDTGASSATMPMKARFLILVELALLALIQPAPRFAHPVSQDHTPAAGRLAVRHATVPRQVQRGVPEDPSPAYLDCLAEDSDETSSAGSQAEAARQAGDGRIDAVGTCLTWPRRTCEPGTPSSHPLIYRLCTLLI
jgi:hypothetical protein